MSTQNEPWLDTIKTSWVIIFIVFWPLNYVHSPNHNLSLSLSLSLSKCLSTLELLRCMFKYIYIYIYSFWLVRTTSLNKRSRWMLLTSPYVNIYYASSISTITFKVVEPPNPTPTSKDGNKRLTCEYSAWPDPNGLDFTWSDK